MSAELKPKDMSILKGNDRIEVRSANFNDFYWPEFVWFEGKKYSFGFHIPLGKARSIIWSSSAIYNLVKESSK